MNLEQHKTLHSTECKTMKQKPRKIKELTLRERWLQLKMSFVDIPRRKRTPKEFRNLLKSRKKAKHSSYLGWDYHPKTCEYNKYERAKEAFEKFKTALNQDDFQVFQNALKGMENAMKFQGYLQMAIVFLEWRLSKMNNKELKRKLLLEEI